MAPKTDDKSDAAKTLDSLGVGDVIRLPKFYKNALEVVETTAIGIRVEFVDDSLAARGSSKDLIRSKYTGEYGLITGTTSKGTVWTVEVVTRRDADDDADEDDEENPIDDLFPETWLVPESDDEDAELLTDGGEDLVEFTIQFEKPVTAADLRTTFRDLADAAAGEDAEDDPVANAEAFEDLLADVVERAVASGVHPSDASAILFCEANDLAASMWSPDRDDAEIIP